MRTDERSSAMQVLTIAALLILAMVMLTTASSALAAKKLSPSKAVALEKRLGDRASGTYLDRRSGNMVIAVTDAATARRVRKAGAIARIVPRSATELGRIVKRIRRTKRVANIAWGIDPVANRVVLSIATTVSPKDRARLTGLVRPFGKAVRIESMPPLRPTMSGGENVVGPRLACSLGFNVTVNGAPHFLTAGHCTAVNPTWTVPGATTGTRFPGSDYGIVRYTDPAPPAPSNVNLYDGRFQPITGAGEAFVNQRVSKSGATTGLTSGTVQNIDMSFLYDVNGRTVLGEGLVETDVCTDLGDSGGGLFAGSTALALVVGSSYGGCRGPGYRSYFNPVIEALNTFGAVIPGAAPTNRPPVARFSAARKPGVGNLVTLDGTGSSDPDGKIADWRWSIGTTTIASGNRPTVKLGDVTSATITLTVTDNQGATNSTTRTIDTPNRPPAITGVSPATGAVVGSNTPFLSVTATDDDGDTVQQHYRVTGPATDISSGWIGSGWRVPEHKLDPGTRYEWTVTVKDPRGLTAARSSWFRVAMLPTATEMISVSTGDGYWQVASDGGVFSFGSARFLGSLPGLGVRVTNIIGMARTADDGGYWLVGSDGGVFAFGNAPFVGSLPGLGVRLNNIVGMAPTKDGRGYWLVGSDGGVFAFGTAQFHGSMGGRPLNAPVARMAPTTSGNGYWLVARDGGIFSFGDAPFYGSMGGTPLNKPVVDVDVAPDGAGYWLTAEDGGIFAFGSAPFHGSLANTHLNGRVTSMSPTPDGGGYWLTGCDGGVFTFGNAPFFGSDPRYGCRGT